MTGAQILIVEDERLIAHCMKSELESMGYGVPAIAASGEEALARFSETKPDLVLMDIVLKGGLDGIETTKRLRQRSHVPVVYLSAHRDPELVERAKATEPLGFLLKPYEENELRTTIEMALHRHAVEERAHDAERWLHSALAALPDAVIATDVLQRVGYLNSAAERLSGFSASEAKESDLERVLQIRAGEAGSAVAQAERMTLESGAPASLPPESNLMSRDGRQIPVEGTCTPVINGEGFYTGFVWVVRDVSERRAAAEAMRQRQAESAARPQPQELTGVVAHEFNNLLTMILGNTSLVLGRLPEHDANLQAVLNIHAAASRAVDLVQRAQGHARRSSQPLALTELHPPLQKVCETLPLLISEAITLAYRPGKDVWPIHSTSELVEELAINLCLGICESMSRGGKLVLETDNVTFTEDEALFQSHARAGDFVRMRLCDTGGCWSDEPQQGILDEPARRELDGALNAARELVHQHQGWIDCLSAAREGTRVDVYLPRAQGVRPEPRPGPRLTTTFAARKTVLLVDDEQMLRDLGHNILSLAGYQVIVAEDGHEAIQTFARDRDRIGVVILDLTMPRLSGDQTFRELLRLDADVRVLFCSGYPEDHVKSLHHPQVCGFLTKPYRNEELLAAVRAALGEKSPTGASGRS